LTIELIQLSMLQIPTRVRHPRGRGDLRGRGFGPEVHHADDRVQGGPLQVKGFAAERPSDAVLLHHFVGYLRPLRSVGFESWIV
jgi:hypothetical protein